MIDKVLQKINVKFSLFFGHSNPVQDFVRFQNPVSKFSVNARRF